MWTGRWSEVTELVHSRGEVSALSFLGHCLCSAQPHSFLLVSTALLLKTPRESEKVSGPEFLKRPQSSSEKAQSCSRERPARTDDECHVPLGQKDGTEGRGADDVTQGNMLPTCSPGTEGQ